MLEIESETFAGTFPFPPRYLDLGHVQMHYVDVGSGDPVVMLHGDPTIGEARSAWDSPSGMPRESSA